MKHRVGTKILITSMLFILLIPTIIIFGKNSNHVSAVNTPAYLTFENFNPKAELGTKENPFIILEIVPCRWMGQIGYIIDGQELIEPTLSNIGDINGIASDALIESNGTVKNTELFKKKVLNLTDAECADYHIRVVTITPDVLNENAKKFSKYYDLNQNGKNNKILEMVTKGEIDLIGNADLISISPMAQGGNETAAKLWNSSRRDKSEPATTIPHATFKDNDLSWQTAMELFMKVGIVDDSAALVYDLSVFQAPIYQYESVQSKIGESRSGYCNNVYKLILMIRQSDPAIFYEKYLKADTGEHLITYNKTVNSGSFNAFSSNEAIYWNEYTFLPAYPDGTYPKNTPEEYKKYLKSMDYIIPEISGYCSDSVIRNAYAYNGGTSIVQSFTTDRNDIVLKEIVMPDTDVRLSYNVELFDYLEKKAKETNANASRPTIARPCEAVEYILSKKKEKKYKESITVLDLEPCNDFTLTEEQVRAMLPSYTGIIKIKQQTTAEFIGKTEDITQIYDLIYIGTNTGKMKTDGTKTVYNDPMLDGYVYLRVGDRVVGYDTFKGSLRNQNGSIGKAINHINFNNLTFNKLNILESFDSKITELPKSTDLYRYSGNDITSLKEALLVEYLDAGYPILIENELYTPNNEVVDDQSYLYKFLSTCKEDKYKNQVFNRKDFTDNPGSAKTLKSKLMTLVQKEKLSVELTNTPVKYQPDDSSTLIVDRKLSFDFTIQPITDSDSDTKFTWSIYVDANADGLFSINEERELDGTSTAGDIRCSITLSEEYVGVVPWKLEVTKVDNSKIRWSSSGFAAFKVPTMDETEKRKTQIDVLQITSNVSTLNLQELMNPGAGKTSLFHQFTKDLDDFNIAITTVDVNEFVNWYKKGGKYEASKPKTDQLKDYDMLIFGFGDCYSDISNEYGALNNVQNFIKSGRSVMFTHDTTSFVNLPEAEYKDLNKRLAFWGYGMNQYVRSIAGMDRFNAQKQMQNTSVYDEAIMPELIADKVRANGIYKNLIYSKDNKLCYPEIQGLTNGCLVAYSNPDEPLEDLHTLNKNYPPFIKGNDIIKSSGINNYITSYVTKVNEGQITSYPYKIPDSFKISETHLQYYQLNMDDPDIVVWFCLSDGKSNEFSENGKNKDSMEHSKEIGPYSVSPNDVRNNYYIYSKKNIMYTGVGHSKMDAIVNKGSTTGNNKDEVKLFINTMIASYNAGIVPPTVEITNTEAKKSSDGYVWYQYYQEPRKMAQEKKRIKFKAYDTNLSSNDLVARIYKVKVDTNTTSVELIEPTGSNGIRVFDSVTNTAVSTYNGSGEAGHNIKADTEYTFEYSMEDFSQDGSAQIYITVTNKDNLSGNTNLKLLNRSLFDLD